MHELSVSSAVVDTALRHAGGRRITVVDLRLGKLRQVVPRSLSFYFEIVGRDTLCEGAELRLEMVDALMRCGSCGNEWDPEPKPEHGDVVGGDLLLPQFRCPECQAAGAEVVRGNELEVESIEVSEEPPTDPASSVRAGTGGTASGQGPDEGRITGRPSGSLAEDSAEVIQGVI